MKVETDIIACIFCYQVNYYFTIMYYVIRWHALYKRSWVRPSALFNKTNITHMTTSVSRRLNMLIL